MQLLPLVLDNPVLVKHIRSRLRPQHLYPSMVGIGIVSIIVVWGGFATDSVRQGIPFMILALVQGSILFLAGTSQVGTAVAQAKTTGILDFHRISPQTPTALTVGFLLGGPIREYILFACTLPFSLLCVLMGKPGLLEFLMIVAAMLSASLLYHVTAVIAGLVGSKTQNVSGGVVGFVLMLYFFSSVPFAPGATHLTIIPTYMQAMDWGTGVLPASSFYGLPVPRFLLTLIHQLPLIGFLFIAAVRKMRSDRAFFYTKPVAVAFMGLLAFLITGDTVGYRDPSGVLSPTVSPIAAVYGMVIAGLVLGTAVTPGAGDYAGGVRRARKEGRARPALWSDLAANWAPLAAFSAILLVAAAVAATLSVEGGGWTGQTIAAALVGACVVFYFGSAKQAFELMFRKAAQSFLVLFIFILWIVPLIIGWVAEIAQINPAFRDSVLGISPIAGIALAASPQPGSAVSAGGSVAAVSSLLLVISFIVLRMRIERRAEALALKPRE